MSLVISEEYLPATLTTPHMTDDEFAAFCAQYPDFFIETTADGEAIIIPPNYPWTSMQNGEIVAQLKAWAQADGRGLVTDSSGGFVLPNGARRAPDASWISRRQLASLPPDQLKRSIHACPEFVLEVRWPSDRLRTLRAKMQEWIDNGAELAWMIDPETQSVEIYRPNQSPELLRNITSLTASSPLEGFTLDLTRVWDPLAR